MISTGLCCLRKSLIAGLEVAQTFDRVPRVVSWQGSPPDAPAEPSRQSGGEDEYYVAQKMYMSKPLDGPDLDQSEMCVDFELGGISRTSWKR